MYHKREELRSLREHVMLVVRDYSRVVDMLSLEERNLFRERIRFLDKKVQPGLTKLTWASKGISEYYVADCRYVSCFIALLMSHCVCLCYIVVNLG